MEHLSKVRRIESELQNLGVAVMGHLDLTPQARLKLGGLMQVK